VRCSSLRETIERTLTVDVHFRNRMTKRGRKTRWRVATMEGEYAGYKRRFQADKADSDYRGVVT
jgi:hypothetical protein